MDPLLWASVFVLVASFLSNVSPFVGASYTLLATVQLTALGFTVEAFAVLVIVSAAGATLAKVAIYYGAFGLRGLLVRNKNVRLIGRYSSTRGFYLALFVTAILPVFPLDDFIYIGAGATSASLGLMAAATLVAKVMKSAAEIALEFTILRGIASRLQIHQLDLTIAFTAAFVVIGVLIYKIDWEGALNWLGVGGGSAPVPGARAA
ncbi:MAG: hypothetical protein JRM80_08535 [Nitrososphaerota archaeon]|nr:hypothetical protein [Nitrososphaerota archaeon]